MKRRSDSGARSSDTALVVRLADHRSRRAASRPAPTPPDETRGVHRSDIVAELEARVTASARALREADEDRATLRSVRTQLAMLRQTVRPRGSVGTVTLSADEWGALVDAIDGLRR